jgi:hypothetical protein
MSRARGNKLCLIRESLRGFTEEPEGDVRGGLPGQARTVAETWI